MSDGNLGELNSSQEELDAKTAKAAKKAARRAEDAARQAAEERRQKELRDRRVRQIEDLREAEARIRQGAKEVLKNIAACQRLSDHVEGFYEEIDKLTKGKSLIEVTDLAVEQANCIIRDAKQIVHQDPHLDRVSEFVPAGNNPVYPDVLLTVRTVRQSLGRCETELQDRATRLKEALSRAQTAEAALGYFLETGEDFAPEKGLDQLLDGSASKYCMSFDRDEGQSGFDFDRLDRQTLGEYLQIEIDEAESTAERQAGDPRIERRGDDHA